MGTVSAYWRAPAVKPTRRVRVRPAGGGAAEIRFVNLIVDELTQTGLMEPGRLFESPYTDHAPTGPDLVFPQNDVETIVDILHQVRDRALPVDVA